MNLLQYFKKVIRCTLFLFASIMYVHEACAQQFNWGIPTGGGTADGNIGRTQSGGQFLCTDKAGNAYIIGLFDGVQDFDPGSAAALIRPLSKNADTNAIGIYMAKYDSKGMHLWSKCIASNEYRQDLLIPYDVVVDNFGRITVVGRFMGKLYYSSSKGVDSISSPLNIYDQNDESLFLAQYDSAGNPLWLKTVLATPAIKLNALYPGKASMISAEGGMSVDNAGNIYITGFSEGSFDFDPGSAIFELSGVVLLPDRTNGATGAFVAKYRANGDFCWAKEFVVDSAVVAVDSISRRGKSHHCKMRGVAVDTVSGLNDVLCIGYFEGSIDFDPGPGRASLQAPIYQGDICMVKLDSNGNYKWVKQIAGTGHDEVSDIILSNVGNIHISGETFSSDLDFDPGAGNAAIPPIGNRDIYIAKYDIYGSYIWAKRMGGANYCFAANLTKLGTDPLENVYIKSQFTGYAFDTVNRPAVDFDPGPDTALFYLEAYSSSAQQFPVESWSNYLAQYDACGNYLWAGEIQDGLYTSIDGLVMHPVSVDSFAAYVVGKFDNVMGMDKKISPDFDPGPGVFRISSKEPLVLYYFKKLTFGIPQLDTTLNVSICAENYEFRDSIYTTSGKYLHRNSDSCSGFVLLDLKLSLMAQPVITVDTFVLGVLGSYATYQWLLNGVLIPGATDSVFTALENGNYTVIVSNGSGCTDTSEIYGVTNVGIESYGIDRDAVRIYPNPAHDYIYIDAREAVNVAVIDLAGRRIKSIDSVRGLNVRDLTPGLYLVEIRKPSGRLLKREKLVIK